MGYIRKSDITFIIYMNRKYKDYQVGFEFIDDYLLWVYEELCHFNEIFYYQKLEEDLAEYSDFQTGKEREMKEKLC